MITFKDVPEQRLTDWLERHSRDAVEHQQAGRTCNHQGDTAGAEYHAALYRGHSDAQTALYNELQRRR